MATVDTAWISAASGLVGALVGASAALGGKWIDAHHARKAEHRRQAAELLARFWEVTDRLWRLTLEAEELDRWAQYPVGESVSPDLPPVSEKDLAAWRREVAERRLEVRDANGEAGTLLGRMRLLDLPMTEEASALRLESARGFAPGQKPLAKRKAALEAFEKAASRFMGV